MRWILLFPLLLRAAIFEVVPDYEGYVETMFPADPNGPYGNLGTWGKIQYVLHKKGHTIRGASLRNYSDDAEDIEREMQERGVEKIIIQNVPWYVGYDRMEEFPMERLALVVYEPPSVVRTLHDPDYYDRFSKVYTWDDAVVDGDKFVKMHYPVMYPMKHDLPRFDEKQLLCMICRNKASGFADEIYSERRRAVDFFDGSGDFDLFGYGWETEGLGCYQGSIDDKYATLINYRFSICFENTKNIQGYITEKIFDCFHAGSVPVYLGADNITDYVPKDCFIDFRDYGSYEELYAALGAMTRLEYKGYLKRIRKYLRSPKAKMFSDDHFVKHFIGEILGIEVSDDDLR